MVTHPIREGLEQGCRHRSGCRGGAGALLQPLRKGLVAGIRGLREGDQCKAILSKVVNFTTKGRLPHILWRADYPHQVKGWARVPRKSCKMQDELEQNRQHLVRALRAVEATTAETREEADAAMERVSEMETALEVQAETVRDLREQVYALQLRSASEHQRTMRIQEDDLGSLTQRVVRVEEQEHRVEEVALGLEKLGSWVQTTIQQRAVEYERQLSISNIAMQTYVQQQIESLCLAHMEDLRESVEQLRSENKHLHEQLANQRGHARSTGGDLLIEGGSP